MDTSYLRSLPLSYCKELRASRLKSPRVLLLLRFRFGFRFLLLVKNGKETTFFLQKIFIIGRATSALHVREVLGILDGARIDREQILAPSLLPLSKASRLEGGDARLAKILSLILICLLVLDFIPLLL